MNHHDLDWLTAQRPEGQAFDPDARERALRALVRHASPSPAGRRLRVRDRARVRAFGFAGAGAVAAVAAVVVLSAGDHAARDLIPATTVVTQGDSPPGTAIHHHGAAHSSLVRLADYVSASDAPAGDATLVARTTTTGGKSVTVYDLYADDGKYYFSRAASGLSAQVSAGHNLAGGLFAREVAAAKLAANGDVRTAAQNMADAPDPSHVISPDQKVDRAALAAKQAATGQRQGGGSLYDNWVWENSQDAIIAGSGQPDVRAGVLRILATLPGVTVTDGTSNGGPTLVLDAGAPEVGPGYTEQLTIDANTGVPIRFVGGPPNEAATTTVDYKVTRVTLADLASETATTG